jgi:16S rRNA processing protein RimM
MDSERVIVAEVVRPRGNRGELVVKSQTDVPERLEHLKIAQARMTGGYDVPVQIVEAWTHKGDWVLKFAGVDSIDSAERFRGAEIWVPISERGNLPEGEFFRSDLIGCSVIELLTGKRLGVVEGWQQYGGPPLMEVMIDGSQVLIPFVSSICQHVDLTAREIGVDLPEGLLEL